jgi:hypothetical protein
MWSCFFMNAYREPYMYSIFEVSMNEYMDALARI